jgi:hypothetical protein|tara:strand:- start:300 stop:512 length:213 start_codon:yes stop_codon:yes gene_type:complete
MTEDVSAELRNIRNALNDMYDKLNVTFFEKDLAVKTTYREVKPFDLVSDNFNYIADRLTEIEGSIVAGEE